jgi:hypothetical protein
MQIKMIGLMVFVWVFGLLGCNGRETFCKDSSDGWISLLKGNTLDGWYTYLADKGANADKGTNQDPDGIFTIHEGVLHIYKNAEEGSKMPYGYIATEDEYENYHLRLEFKWGRKKFAPRAESPRDSGLLYHFVGDDTIWPLSTECQIMEGDTGTIYTVGTTVTTTINPATRVYQEAADGGMAHTQGGPEVTWVKLARDLEVPGWNSLEVIIRGDSAVHIINGKVNNRCWNISRQDPSDSNRLIPLSRGKILLQAEGAEVYFRNVQIKSLE